MSTRFNLSVESMILFQLFGLFLFIIFDAQAQNILYHS
jgi:hypothetical protein